MGASGIDDVVSLVRAAAATTGARRTVIVGIDGRAGSGKTTIAAAVARALGDCPIVHMDDIYPGWDGLAASIPILVADILEPIAAGRPARFRRWDWAAAAPGAVREIPPPATLVIEGVGSGARPTAAFVDVPVWIDAPAQVRKQRALARDGEMFAANWDRWRDQEELLFTDDPVWERAAIVLDGTATDAR
ncbi:hypothetical protein [Millisia brevis]|uniref:hypothetical protein n=1 Tax=Millisia brevis TaxID=264148 RepID=UPI0008301B7A|nr:hypothetical protein [Millisia brevis]